MGGMIPMPVEPDPVAYEDSRRSAEARHTSIRSSLRAELESRRNSTDRCPQQLQLQQQQQHASDLLALPSAAPLTVQHQPPPMSPMFWSYLVPPDEITGTQPWLVAEHEPVSIWDLLTTYLCPWWRLGRVHRLVIDHRARYNDAVDPNLAGDYGRIDPLCGVCCFCCPCECRASRPLSVSLSLTLSPSLSSSLSSDSRP